MNSRHKHTLQALRRVQGWLRARQELQAAFTAAAGSTSSPLAQQIAELDELIEQFSAYAARQETAVRSAKGATEEARRLRAQLLKDNMQHIADIAKAAIPDVVQVTAAFRMSTTPRDHEGLIAAAEAMAKAGEQYQATLTARGLSPDFVVQLRMVASALRTAIDARGQSRANHRGATEGVDVAIREGRKLVLSLSVIVKQRLRSDTVALAEWQQLKRVTLQGVRAHSAPPSATVAVPSVTSSDRAATSSGPAAASSGPSGESSQQKAA